jgi:Rrf2 family protein
MLSRTGIHAIRATAVLARLPEGECRGAQQVAADAGLPASYVTKVLQVLARAGVVESRKGPGGGFRLARPADAVSLWDLLEPVERVSRRVGCLLGRATCSEESPCALHDRWSGIRGGLVELLCRTTLADVARHPAGGPMEALLAAETHLAIHP